MKGNTYQLTLTVCEQVDGDVYRLAESVDSERIRITFGEARADIEVIEVVSTQVRGY